jgi:glycine betaine/proline transport system substrate-binding protein
MPKQKYGYCFNLRTMMLIIIVYSLILIPTVQATSRTSVGKQVARQNPVSKLRVGMYVLPAQTPLEIYAEPNTTTPIDLNLPDPEHWVAVVVNGPYEGENTVWWKLAWDKEVTGYIPEMNNDGYLLQQATVLDIPGLGDVLSAVFQDDVPKDNLRTYLDEFITPQNNDTLSKACVNLGATLFPLEELPNLNIQDAKTTLDGLCTLIEIMQSTSVIALIESKTQNLLAEDVLDGIQTYIQSSDLISCADFSGDLCGYIETAVVPRKNITIKLGVNPWLGSQLNVEVAKILLDEYMGYDVETVEIDASSIWEAIDTGDIHTSLEVWNSAHMEDYAEYIDNRQTIEYGGELGMVGRVGWYIPTYVAEQNPNLTTWEAYINPENAALFATDESNGKGVIFAGDRYWGHYEEDIIRNLNLQLEVVYADEGSNGEDVLIEQLDEAYQAQKPILIYFWEPHWVQAVYDLTLVTLPPYSDECYETANSGGVDCDYPTENLYKIFWAGLADYAPEAHTFLQNFSYTTDDQNRMQANVIIENMTAEEAARLWIQENETVWRAWLPSKTDQSDLSANAEAVMVGLLSGDLGEAMDYICEVDKVGLEAVMSGMPAIEGLTVVAECSQSSDTTITCEATMEVSGVSTPAGSYIFKIEDGKLCHLQAVSPN